MFKNVFFKYFTAVALVMAVSFAALCGAQTFLSARYWREEKRAALSASAETVAEYTAACTHRAGDGFVIDPNYQPFFSLLGRGDTELNRVLVTNGAGKVIISTTEEAERDSLVPAAVMRQVKQTCTPGQTCLLTGTLEGVYGESQYTAVAAVPFGGETIAYAFVSAPTRSLSVYLHKNLQMFLIAALTVLALTFAVTYLLTYRMVQPLREMAEATRRFATGDFSVRVKVRGKDEVAELADALNHMAVSLSSVEEMRRSFVTNVSHELKTPMTTIAGFIDGILDGTVPPERQSHYLHIVSDEVKRLSRLVKSMLDLSRIDSGQLKVNPAPFDLTEVACNTLLQFEQRLESKRITVTGLEEAAPCPVTADYDLIGQVVYNLLDNATKFINEEGTLTLTVTRQPGRACLRVRNTGQGLAAGEMPHIFERFYKTDRSRSLDKQGVGLGLYIVKNVISLHGGEITVRSVEGEYCEFEFWLPAK